MKQTYEVYLTGADGQTRLLPIMSESEVELIGIVRRALQAEPDREAVAHVELRGKRLFTLEA